jgi:hypothetical protein
VATTIPAKPASGADWNTYGTALDAAVREVQAASGVSLKTIEDASRSVYAMKPSTESGLTAIAADNSTNDAPRIQAMLTYLKTTYGGGQLFLPYGRTSVMGSGITIPAGVQIVGSETTRWDFFNAGSAATAITVNDNHFVPIRGLRIGGSQYDANTNNANVTTSTGIQVKGYNLSFVDVHISGFNTGMDFTNDDTFLINCYQCTIDTCVLAVNCDMSNVWTGGAAQINNSGERMSFVDSIIANCGTGFWATGGGLGLNFTTTSFDFVKLWGRIRDAHVFFDQSHLESTGIGTAAAATSGGTRNSYMFEMSYAARLNMVNTNIVLAGDGVYHVVDPSVGPTNYGSGMAHFVTCDAYNKAPAGAGGQSNGYFSEQLWPVTAGATTVTVYSIFLSRWSTVKASVVATDGSPEANVTARITGIDQTNGTVTVTLSAAAPSGTFLELNF